MGRPGRKRKQGKRHKCGKLVSPYDKGTAHAQAMQALYGADGTDAIGRAYRSGLIGQGAEAKAVLDLARSLSRTYWRAFETGAIKSTLGGHTPGQSVIPIDHAKVRRQEQWLREVLAFVNTLGPNVRRAFDQLAIDPHPESGPAWLDRLIYAERTKADPLPADKATLRAALDALETIAAG